MTRFRSPTQSGTSTDPLIKSLGMEGQNLPDELLVQLKDHIYCRDSQIRQLGLLLGSSPHLPQNLVCHGVEATGKSSTIKSLLPLLQKHYTIVNSKECITTRHLLERTITSVLHALKGGGDDSEKPNVDGRCENLAALVAQLQVLLNGKERFILVFDGIDQQREPAPTLLPALARLGEFIPSLTTILITTLPPTSQLHHSSIPYIHFPPYTRDESLLILSHSLFPLSSLSATAKTSSGVSPPPYTYPDTDAQWLWQRYTAHVWDSLAQSAARDIISFRTLCETLWQPFIQPIIDGLYGVRQSQELSKVLVRNRALLQSEAALVLNVLVAQPPVDDNGSSAKHQISERCLGGGSGDVTNLLPSVPSHLLISAYLASYTHPRHDITLFSRSSLSKRRKKGGGTAVSGRGRSGGNNARKKPPRRLLPPQPFPLERLLAIFHAITEGEVRGGTAEVLTQFATLVALRLVGPAGAGGAQDVLDPGTKWRCKVGEEFVRGVSRGVGVVWDEYVIE